MGLLDWLTDGIGSDMGTAKPSALPPSISPGGWDNAMSFSSKPLLDPEPQGMPQGVEAMPGGQGGPAPAPMPQGIEAMPGGPGGPGGPAPSGVPLPKPRPPQAPQLPPTDVSAASRPPPGPPMSLTPPGGGEQLAPQGSGGTMDQALSQGILGRALGLSPETSKRFGSSLAAGLKSVGENYKKPGLAAMAGSAGSAMEGGNKRDDTAYDQKLKSLQQAVAARAKDDEAGYKTSYIKYLNNKQRSEEAAAASGGGKSGAWNKPDSQKFIDAMNAMSGDRRIVASQKELEQAIKDGDQKRIAQLRGVHDKLTDQVRLEYLTGVGLDPKQIEANMKNPPGSQQNPFKINSRQDFDRYVKPGQAYVNPKDGKVYIRNGEGGVPVDGASSATPGVPAPMNPMNPGAGTMPSYEMNED